MTTSTIKFLCSYGGRIIPRISDGKLRYISGHTRILSVDRYVLFSDLMMILSEFCGASVRMKCQLPHGDLETLISITSEEDLHNIISIYENANTLRIRAILLPPKSFKSISPPSLALKRVTGGRPLVNVSKRYGLRYYYGVVSQQRGNWIV